MVLDKCHFGIFLRKETISSKKETIFSQKETVPIKKETILMENNLNNNNNL